MTTRDKSLSSDTQGEAVRALIAKWRQRADEARSVQGKLALNQCAADLRALWEARHPQQEESE